MPGTHMWTAPGLQEVAQRADRIACDHMSGLLSRSHMTAAKMGSATRVPNIIAVSASADGFLGMSRVLGSIDHAICSFSSKLPASAAGQCCLAGERLKGHAPVLAGGAIGLRAMTRAVRAGRAAKPPASGARRPARTAAAGS